ncbi:MAG TPA: cytochrome c3 family protein [Polyangiaceae bacterium]|nr:cytochrome c3 family protein [Polyangiaceae bacterium]
MIRFFWNWRIGVVVATVLCAALAGAVYSPPLRSIYVPARTSDGHYQIESDCNACHTPFAGVDQQACLNCHADELGDTIDAHRPAVFSDPRNSWMLAKVDALRCVTCHGEHVPETTHAMGVTLPPDFCMSCHADIAKERPSHAGFDASGCAGTACHRYHDNRALYEDFVARHLDDPPTVSAGRVPERNLATFLAASRSPTPPLAATDQNGPASSSAQGAMVVQDWASSSHARAGVNCRACHAPAGSAWSDRPSPDGCKACHSSEVQGFLHSRHGMRLERGLEPMRPGEARLPMKKRAGERELGCGSCHGSHQFDTKKAAAEACLGCHDDRHSLAYDSSPHAKAWREELGGHAPQGSGVSCATCHLPRSSITVAGHARVAVEHNQNDNLRPPDKLVRSVCLSCHGWGFSMSALSDADRSLVDKNFSGPPKAKVKALDLVRRRKER